MPTPIGQSSPHRVSELATRQLADYDARRPGMMFAEGMVLSVAEAYALQAAVAQLRQNRGECIVGYKIGCTSTKIRQQLGIDHSISGRLYDREQHPSGDQLERSKFANLAIEGELAVRLSRTPQPDDFLRPPDQLPTCISHVIPVIELHHLVLRGDPPTASELIANNAIHAGFVAGEGVEPAAVVSTEPSLSITIDGQPVDSCAGSDLIQTIESSLKWLDHSIRDRGECLLPNQLILTGSIPSLIPIPGPCHIQVAAPPFGQVECVVVE